MSSSLDVPAGVTQDFSSTFLLRCMPLFFSREGFSRSFPSSTVKSNFVYQRFNRSPLVKHFIFIFFSEEKSQLPGFELTSRRVRRLRGYQLSYRGDRQVMKYSTALTSCRQKHVGCFLFFQSHISIYCTTARKKTNFFSTSYQVLT